ncbi:MAG: 50S ribosome-binding GTPase [Anaerolineae bacterium]|nr:50S ribosome-binding GTPase [Anaerolineae bacterium]
MTIIEAPDRCQSCPANTNRSLTRLGLVTEKWDYLVALAGNPNTGKSTIFNALTGLQQHTGNWAGKTVVRAEGSYQYDSKTYKIIDLPGIYSLLSANAEEQVARDFILFGRPAVTIVVTDAARLERNLNLALQILEITDQVVIALNLIDEAQRHGIEVDAHLLERKLGVPVVPTSARFGRGIPQLLAAVARVANKNYPLRPYQLTYRNKEMEKAVEAISGQVRKLYPTLPNARWVAMRLLDHDESILNAVQNGTLGRFDPDHQPRAELLSGVLENA